METPFFLLLSSSDLTIFLFYFEIVSKDRNCYHGQLQGSGIQEEFWDSLHQWSSAAKRYWLK